MCWCVKCQHQTDFPGATRQASWTEETMSFAPWIETSSIHATRKSLKILTFLKTALLHKHPFISFLHSYKLLIFPLRFLLCLDIKFKLRCLYKNSSLYTFVFSLLILTCTYILKFKTVELRCRRKQ